MSPHEERIVELRREGLPLAEIARLLGVSPGQVTCVLYRRVRRKLPGTRASTRLTDEGRDRIVQLRRQGWRAKAIAEVVGVAASSVWRVLREEMAPPELLKYARRLTPADRAKVKRADAEARRAEVLTLLAARLAEVRRLRGEGLSLREIGRRLGVTGERVRQILLKGEP